MATLAIVGATGLVGRECLACLEEDQGAQQLASLRLIASARSAGKKMLYRGESLRVENLEMVDFSEIDLAIFAAGGELSKKFAPIAVESGTIVIDNSSAFRYDDAIPLVVPEVNPEDIHLHHGLIANPNCSTAQLMVAVAPIHVHTPIKRMIVSTYQSASGAGAAGERVLYAESEAAINDPAFVESNFKQPGSVSGGEILGNTHHVNPHKRRLAFNLIPQIDVFLENGYTKEEMKIVWETRKILHAPEMEVSATAVRVPVFRCHSESVTLDLAEPLSRAKICELLSSAPGVRLLDSESIEDYPTPLDAAGNNDTWVGRVRVDPDRPSSVHLWVVSDNLRKGAAKNALQIAEKVLEMM